MKHLLPTALLCGLSILGASAQNIVITDKDGVPHKFNADYVKEITFEKIESIPEVTFSKIHVQTFGLNLMQVTFNSDDVEASLEMAQPNAYWLQPGEYLANPTDPGLQLNTGDDIYVKIGEEKKKVQDGKVVVSLEGDVYTFTLDLTLEGGAPFKGTYTGKLDWFGPTMNVDLTNVMYLQTKDPTLTGINYDFYPINYSVDMRIYIFADGALPAAGIYNFSDTKANGTADSLIDVFSLSSYQGRYESGTVTVSYEGNIATVEIEGKLGNGLTLTAKYTGELPAKEIVKDDSVEMSLVSDSLNGKNAYLTFECKDDGTQVNLDMYQPADAEYLQAGTYKVSENNEDFTFDPIYTRVSFKGEDAVNVKEGTITVTLDKDVYTIIADLTLTNGKTFKGKYVGKMETCGPQPEVLNFNLTAVKYVSVNEPAANGFYYRFNDTPYNTEMRIDLFSEGDKPAAGVYNFSDTKVSGTADSLVDVYQPSSAAVNSGRFVSGTVTLSYEGDTATLAIEGTLSNDKNVTATYTGTLPARTNN